MDGIFAIIGVVLVLALLGGAVSGWVALAEMGKLRRTVAALQQQVKLLKLRIDVDPGANMSSTAAQSTQADAKPIDTTRAEAQSLRPVIMDGPTPDEVAPEPTRALEPTRTPLPPMPQPGKAFTKPAPKPKTPIDLETLLGAKGSVWIGGLALLFGAVFLLRYTIEAGLFTPFMRLSGAVLMGVIALGLSEWMARRDLKTPVGKALSAKADIPAILSAVGVFTLFGAVYAAHALYGMIGTMPTFGLLAAIALGAMGLSLRRGPWLAAIGLVGAMVVPLLVASVTPSFIGVIAYIAIIAAAALWVAQRQAWAWLRGAALVGSTVWLTILLGKAVDGLQLSVWVLGVAVVTALTLRNMIRASGGKYLREWGAVGWTGIAVLTALAIMAGDDLTPVSYALPFAFVGGLIATAWRNSADRFWPLLIIGGGAFAGLGAYVWPQDIATPGLFFAAFGLLAGVFSLAVLSVATRLTKADAATALTIGGGAIATAFMTDGVGTVSAIGTTPETWAGFCLAGLFAVATVLQKRLSVVRGAIVMAGGLWVMFAFKVWGVAMTSGLLSAGLAGVIALALFSKQGRDDLWVRLVPLGLAGAAGLVAVDTLANAGQHISTTPFANALWLYLGLPGALAAIGAVLLGRRREDLASQSLLGGAIVFGLLLVVLLIHHAMNAGDLSVMPGFEDFAVQLLVAFAAMFGASWLRGGLTDWPSKNVPEWRYIIPVLAMGATGVSLLLFVTQQFIRYNPLLSAETVIDGHPVFNSLLLGYLAPAILLGAAALRFSGHRPAWFVRLLGALAGISWLVWTAAQIRRFAQGEVIAMDRVPWGNGELYAVSAIWLLTGIALLLAGLKSGRRDLRLASAGLITLTSLKVFLVDMSALDGAFRAISFIGLGIVLIGIGRLYQKVLAGSGTKADDTPI